ncbi:MULTISPECIES: class I SAM-dependent methyltransferase [Streptomyces]|uniref:Class I SAM-dependent methyltransferase n=1 Tax=Streptomyces heilongjiangensis TaxID=945052 RepID=A0ABW1B7E5_9ACTN|nr:MULTISPECIES: class I SAM-dependent methyltransferase [Streptomyces]MDC2946982.1 class I SAM-dependent methyltransferase [Streptomyces heilongjiangensis]
MKISLTGAAETLLAPLCARALDANSAHPLLGDRIAAELVDRIDYDFDRLGIGEATAVGVALRARYFDRRVRAFLDTHPECTVVHLGCGLDSRHERLAPGPGVRWYDLDQPDVIDVRKQLYPTRPGHETLAASVTEPDWPALIPTDHHPVLVVAEGLTMYLSADEGPRMLNTLVAHFPHGEMLFDTYSRFAVRSTRSMTLFRKTGARLAWGVDDPRELERRIPGMRLLEADSAYATADGADLRHLPRGMRLRMRFDTEVLSRLPVLGRVGHISRYAFGARG